MNRALPLLAAAMLLALGCSATPRLVPPLRYGAHPAPLDEPFRAHPPPAAAVVEPSDPPPTEATLANGLRVVVVERHGFPVAEAVLLVDRGALDLGDLGGNAVDQMTRMYAGGGDESAFERRSSRLAVAGATWMSGVSADAVWAGVRAPARALDESLSILAEGTFQTRLSREEYARRASELAQAARAGRSSISLAELTILFGREHPYGYVRPGLAPIPQAEAEALHERLFQPTQGVLVVVGDVIPAQVVASATRALGGWRATGTLPKQTAAAPAMNRALVTVVRLRALTQTHGAVFARGPDARGDDVEAFEVAAQVLGGAKSSKIWEHLREEGAAYSIAAPVERRRVATWLSLYASYDRDKAVAGVSEVLGSIERLRAGEVTDAEVAIAREVLLARWRTALATVAGAAGAYVAQISLGAGLDRVRDYPARIAKIRREDVVRVANEYLGHDRLHVVFMGEDRWLDPTPLGMGGAATLTLN